MARWPAAVVAVGVLLAGCGVPADARVEAVPVPGFANATTLYRTASADVAVVVLHGGGGSKEGMPHQVALSSAPEASRAAIAWDWLRAHRAVVAFPDGGVRRGSGGSWTPGDTAFLVALAAQLRRDEGVDRVILTGHSAGGIMASRVWCSPESGAFDAYVPISGPPPADVACEPGEARPVLAVIGAADEAIIAGAPWEAPTWRMFGDRTPPPGAGRVLLSELAALAERARLSCAEAPGDPAAEGATTRWEACGGRVRLVRVEGAGHALDTIATRLDPADPRAVLDAALAFGG